MFRKGVQFKILIMVQDKLRSGCKLKKEYGALRS